MPQFHQYPFQPFIFTALNELGFKEMTQVQAEVIPYALKGQNLVVQSQTGSGKSHAFLLPLIDQIQPEKAQVQVVITAPSRELATQLYQLTKQIVKFSPQPIQIGHYIGGTDKQKQAEKLIHQQPHIVIGTPGRILDLMQTNDLQVQKVKTFVVDEADMTMDMGFLETINQIASRMPSQLQLMVFSATIPQQLSVFLNKYVVAPQHIRINPKDVIATDIENYLINTKGRERKQLVYELLTLGHPFLALVFCNTKAYADELATFLKEKGLKVAKLHGGLAPRERKRIMKQITDLDYQYVVASDLAARGIDIAGVSMVINTEIPKELEFFIHRVGRTGRNKLTGTAYTFVTPDDDSAISALEAKGIIFEQVDIVKGEVKPLKQRYRRSDRFDHKQDQVDPTVRAMINQTKKKKVKPGYKRKLKYQIKEHRKQEAKRTLRQENRAKRRANKEKSNS